MNILLAVLAVLPTAVLLCIIYKADKVEKEPLGLMAAVFFFGAMTTISAVFLEWLGGTLLDMIFSSQNIPYLLLNNFFVVAVAEEAGKFFVLKKSTWNNDEFGFAFDGIVYSVCASLGFATIENIMYVVGQGAFYGLQTAIMRAVLSVPGHCIFGVFMGTYYGIAKGYECRGGFDKMKTYTYKAFWVPVMLHGLYDFCLSVNEYPILQFIMIFVFVGLELFMVIKAIKFVKTISDNDLPLRPGFDNKPPVNFGFFDGQYSQQSYYQGQNVNVNGQFAQNQYYQNVQMNGTGQYSQQYYGGQAANGQPVLNLSYQGQMANNSMQQGGLSLIKPNNIQQVEGFKVIQSYRGYDNGPETEKLYDGMCDGLTNPAPVFSASDFD